MKKNNNGNGKKNIIIFLLLVAIALIVLMIILMPKNICHIEIENKRIELKEWSSGNYDSNCIDFDGEIMCENGITIYKYSKRVCNWEDGTRFCLVKQKNKICEIK